MKEEILAEIKRIKKGLKEGYYNIRDVDFLEEVQQEYLGFLHELEDAHGLDKFILDDSITEFLHTSSTKELQKQKVDPNIYPIPEVKIEMKRQELEIHTVESFLKELGESLKILNEQKRDGRYSNKPTANAAQLYELKDKQGKTVFKAYDDFKCVYYNEQQFSFTANQSLAIEEFHNAYADKIPEVHQARIFQRLGDKKAKDLRSDSLKDLFKNHPAWKTMIIPAKSGTKGMFQLNIE